jgi:hypothetical protein
MGDGGAGVRDAIPLTSNFPYLDSKDIGDIGNTMGVKNFLVQPSPLQAKRCKAHSSMRCIGRLEGT